jgi:hypothetical protein
VPGRLASTDARGVPMFQPVIAASADASRTAAPPTFMAAAKAGALIASKVDGAAPLTVADAAAKTGLALRDAESGLKWLSTEYRGRLRVTAEGELVHLFPYGFSKPWEGADARRRFFRAAGRAIASAARFVVRAWVAVVLVGYAAIFLAVIIAMAFARQGSDSRRGSDLPGGAVAATFLRVVSDALFWTFHPWSPVSVYGYGGGWRTGWDAPASRRYGARSREPGVPLYERVNRFFFGPSAEPEDPLAAERGILAAIRAGKGRIGLADVMRVTGLPRDRADPLMSKLMLDYDGDVGVSEDGGIFYSFPAMRKTASSVSPAGDASVPPPAWARAQPLAPLTGNTLGTNFAIAGLNAFNLFMGLWSVENGMTLERVSHLFDRFPHPIHDTGTALALGVVPFVFSTLLFALPLARAALRPLRARAATEERGRLALLRVVLERLRKKEPVTDKAVNEAWRVATGNEPDTKRINAELLALGGDVSLEESPARWRFAELETEAAAVEAEREAASEEEARLGKVVFDS